MFSIGDRLIIDREFFGNKGINLPKTFYKLEKRQETVGYLLVEKISETTGGIKIEGLGGSWGFKRFKKYGISGKDHYQEITLL